MRYVEARIDEHDREEAYRIYVTQSLRLAPQGEYLQNSYIDIVEHRIKKPKTGDEIAFEIITNAGLSFGD